MITRKHAKIVGKRESEKERERDHAKSCIQKIKIYIRKNLNFRLKTGHGAFF